MHSGFLFENYTSQWDETLIVKNDRKMHLDMTAKCFYVRRENCNKTVLLEKGALEEAITGLYLF